MENCYCERLLRMLSLRGYRNTCRYRHSESAVEHYRGKVPSRQANEPGATSTSANNYINVGREADWEIAGLSAAKEPLERTVLKTKYTELQKACRRPRTFLFLRL